MSSIASPSSTSAPADAYLVVQRGSARIEVVPLAKGTPVTVGRANTNRVVVADGKCSRQHCEIFSSDGRWYVRDLGSRNGITIDGKVSNADSTDQLKRFEASGWNTVSIDGHDQAAIEKALLDARKSTRPLLIAAKTTIGFGAPKKAGTEKVHGSPLGAEELAAAKAALGITYPAFEIPKDTLEAWRAAGTRSANAFGDWQGRFLATEQGKRDEFARRIKGDLPSGLAKALDEYKQKLAADKPKVATRKSSQMALDVINANVPETVGGSADLTGSNLTNTKETLPLTDSDRTGRYVRYGIREHGMAAIMNGIALHGGFIPYGGTFLVFSDYARNALRMAALMRRRVIYVFTHDSIGLGEDGPTHQPVEHAASLRLIPGMDVWRPCDTVEAAVAWTCAVPLATAVARPFSSTVTAASFVLAQSKS